MKTCNAGDPLVFVPLGSIQLRPVYIPVTVSIASACMLRAVKGKAYPIRGCLSSFPCAGGGLSALSIGRSSLPRAFVPGEQPQGFASATTGRFASRPVGRQDLLSAWSIQGAEVVDISLPLRTLLKLGLRAEQKPNVVCFCEARHPLGSLISVTCSSSFLYVLSPHS